MRRKLVPLVLVVMIIGLTGCWNRRELNELAIVMGLGLDLEDNGQKRVTVQIVNPQVANKQKGRTSGGGGSTSPVLILDEQGDTLFEAVRRLYRKAPRHIYFSHVRAMIIGERLAREGIADSLDLWSRDPEIRTDFPVLVAKNSQASDILRVPTLLDTIPSNRIMLSIEIAERRYAAVGSIGLDQLLDELLQSGREPTLPGIVIQRDGMSESTLGPKEIESQGRLVFNNIAVFQKDRLVGWMNERESKGYRTAIGKVRSLIVSVPCEASEGFYSIEIIRMTRHKMKLRQVSGRPGIRLEVGMEGNVGAIECKDKLASEDDIRKLETKGSQQIAGMVERSIAKSQQLHADIYGFGRRIEAGMPKYWKEVGNAWSERYPELPVEVEVHLDLRRVGTTNKALKNQVKE